MVSRGFYYLLDETDTFKIELYKMFEIGKQNILGEKWNIRFVETIEEQQKKGFWQGKNRKVMNKSTHDKAPESRLKVKRK